MNLSFKECRVRSNLYIAQKKLIHWTEKDLPTAAYFGTIYLYNPEGSFITCYTWPTLETVYPEYSGKYPGKITTNISFDIISGMNKPTFIFYIDWIKKRDPDFTLAHQNDFDFHCHDDFLTFIKIAVMDGFQIYVKK